MADDKYKKTWIITVCLIGVWLVIDGVLALLDIPTISQMAYHRAQEDPWVMWLTGGLFVWLFVHLFWRWKNIWLYIKGKRKWL